MLIRLILWVTCSVGVIFGQQSSNGQPFPDNYSVYIRALQNGQNAHQATPSPYGAQPSGGYSPPLQPQTQPYRPPLIPQSGFQPLNSYGAPAPPHVQPPQPPQVRNFPQYQPPLAPPQFQPVHSAPSLPHQPPNNNQQVIYVGGQQRQYGGQAPSPSAERPHSSGNGQPVTFSTSYTSDAARHGKVVGSHAAAPAQVIQKAPASEIQFDKGTAAKDKDAANKSKKDDEYVIYYYYYYDDENKKQHKNLTLNFDDIPNLEQYDSPANKSGAVGVARSIVANGVPNSLNGRPANEYAPTSSPPRSATAVSVSVSVSEGPQSPIPNSFRYGNSEIPRIALYKPSPPEPIRPIAAHLPPDGNAVSVASADVVRGVPALSEAVATPPTPSAAAPTVEISESALEKPEEVNDVIDPKSKVEVKKAEATEADVPTTTTTEASTTEEIATTTESSRRPGFGNRRRFNARGSTRGRPLVSTTGAPASTSSTTRRPIRTRPRRPETARLRPTRPRGRTTPAPKAEEPASEETGEEIATNIPSTSSSTTAVPRRFGASTRNRYGNRNTAAVPRSTISTTASSTELRAPRPRAGAGQRGGLFGRTRPPIGRAPGRRPPYLRNRPAVEDEEDKEASKEEVIVAAVSSQSPADAEETSSKVTSESIAATPSSSAPQVSSSSAAAAAAEEETSNQDSPSSFEEEESTEAPHVSSTEANRRNPLFRPRSKSPLFAGNRPRSPLGRPRPQ